MSELPKRLAESIAALGVEFRDDDYPATVGAFYHEGRRLDVVWSTAAFNDLVRTHGSAAGEELLDLVLSEIQERIVRARLPAAFLKELEKLGVETRWAPEEFRWRFYHQGRPLHAVWNPDLADDLKHFKNIDAENEIVEAVLYQIRATIDA